MEYWHLKVDTKLKSVEGYKVSYFDSNDYVNVVDKYIASIKFKSDA
jgi:hypothetical protein